MDAHISLLPGGLAKPFRPVPSVRTAPSGLRGPSCLITCPCTRHRTLSSELTGSDGSPEALWEFMLQMRVLASLRPEECGRVLWLGR